MKKPGRPMKYPWLTLGIDETFLFPRRVSWMEALSHCAHATDRYGRIFEPERSRIGRILCRRIERRQNPFKNLQWEECLLLEGGGMWKDRRQQLVRQARIAAKIYGHRYHVTFIRCLVVELKVGGEYRIVVDEQGEVIVCQKLDTSRSSSNQERLGAKRRKE
jgi:hypothetical protein